MLPDDTRRKIKDITTGAIIEGREDNCTAARNFLCASFPTSTTVKKNFESNAIIKEEQALSLEEYCKNNNLWLSDAPYHGLVPSSSLAPTLPLSSGFTKLYVPSMPNPIKKREYGMANQAVVKSGT